LYLSYIIGISIGAVLTVHNKQLVVVCKLGLLCCQQVVHVCRNM